MGLWVLSGGPGHDLDGGPSGLADLLVFCLALLHQQGELLQEDVATIRSFCQAGQSLQAVDNKHPPPPGRLLLLFLLAPLGNQLQQHWDQPQVQTLQLPCRRRSRPRPVSCVHFTERLK